MGVPVRCSLVAALALILTAPAAAEPSTLLSPPQDVTGTYDEASGTLTLAWMHPEASAMTFHVYENGLRLASTGDTTISIPASPTDFYYVTAEDEDGDESAPSNGPWPWPLSEFLPDCPVVSVEGSPPGVYPDWQCIDEYLPG